MSPGVEPLALADVEAALCALLGQAGQAEAIGEAVAVVERLEVARHQAPPHERRAWDAAIRRALETLRVVREYAPWSASPPPQPPEPPPRLRPLPRGRNRVRMLPREPPRSRPSCEPEPGR